MTAPTTMARSPKVEVGQLFATDGMRFVWRVVRCLPDNVHVVLVQEDEPSRRKTVSAWALLDWGQYVPVTDRRPSD